jgi:hypothetical protein
MIVKFMWGDEECAAEVTSRGTPDECSTVGAPDETFSIRWIADCGAELRDLENAAVEAYLEQSRV